MTYSIIARDPETGEMGVAVQTGSPFVGTKVPWAEAGIGVVATQGMTEIAHGPNGLYLMRNGHQAMAALDAVLAEDVGRERRQVAMIDNNGNVAAHSGSKTVRFSGHVIGHGFAVQANTTLHPTVWSAMATAFSQSTGTLGFRMLAALEAAQAKGGDIRGQRSAALKIVSGTLPSNPWQGTLFDIRIDDHPEPLTELRRLLIRQMAYTLVDTATQTLRDGNIEKALEQYHSAILLDPDEEQLRIWGLFPLSVADRYGQLAEVEADLRYLFNCHPKWVEVVRRYGEGQIFQTDGLLDRILALASSTD
jgi:uncharacterized Ntn-hydrolase superfamily protein